MVSARARPIPRRLRVGAQVASGACMRKSDRQRQALRNSLAATLLLSLLVFPSLVNAQPPPSETPRFDLGGQVLGLRMPSIHEGPGGIGGRFGLHLGPWLRFDTELDYFPQNPSGNFGQSLALFGLRFPFEVLGLHPYLRARAGVIHFGGRFFQDRNTVDTFPAIDVGAGLEIPRSRRLSFRVEAGDLVVLFRGARIDEGFGPAPMHATHNLLVGAGLTFHF